MTEPPKSKYAHKPPPPWLADLKHAVKFAQKVGLTVTGYSIGPDGTLTVQTGKLGQVAPTGETLQEELGKWSP
jgi:hypothetical protein